MGCNGHGCVERWRLATAIPKLTEQLKNAEAQKPESLQRTHWDLSLSYSKVLVTGGAGFIGSHLVERLVEEGLDVTVLDNLSTGKIENLGCLNNGTIRFIKGDIRDRDTVEEALKGVKAALHLAAVSSVPYSVENPQATSDVNVNGTRNLLEASARNCVERFIYVSTCAVYGEPEYLPIDEMHPTRPVSPYAATKLEAEQVCTAFRGAYGLGTVIFRLFNVYGLRMRNDSYAGVIPRFIERLRAGEPPTIYGDGRQTRDFIHEKDVVRALLIALSCKDVEGETFNVATGVPASINQLAHLVIKLFRAEGIRPQHVGDRVGDIRHSYADVKKAKICLGFEARTSLEEGLSTLLNERFLRNGNEQ